jgi:hypothetical protein
MMKMQEIREIAKEKGVKAGRMSKETLIKAIQRAEGNKDCFGGGNPDVCDQVNCLWREDCMGAAAAL